MTIAYTHSFKGKVHFPAELDETINTLLIPVH